VAENQKIIDQSKQSKKLGFGVRLMQPPRQSKVLKQIEVMN
jgi:hypothetical protein